MREDRHKRNAVYYSKLKFKNILKQISGGGSRNSGYLGEWPGEGRFDWEEA